MKPLFDVGRIVLTDTIVTEVDAEYVSILLTRHLDGDWGDLDREDKDRNEDALKFPGNGGRLYSSYEIPQGTVWIITENLSDPEQTVTTILRPSDY